MSTAPKTTPVAMRLPKADLEIIDRAASVRSRSRTEFVREAAVQAAEAVLLENLPVRLNRAAFAHFEAAISGRPTAVPQLVKLLKRRAPWEK